MNFVYMPGRRWAYRMMAAMLAIVIGLGLASGSGTNVRAQTVSVHVPEGISLLGWCGAPTSTGEVIGEYPINTIWLFDNASNAYESDAEALPAPLRNDLDIPTGVGFFVSADEAFDLEVDLVDFELEVDAGLNILAQCDVNLGSDDLFEIFPEIQTLWTFENGAFNSDSTLLPPPLRNPIAGIPTGSGLFINAVESFFVGFGPGDDGTGDQGPGDDGTGDGGGDDGTGDQGPGDDGTGDDGGQANSVDDLRFVSLGEIPAGGGDVTIDVEAGEGSFLFYTQAADIDEPIVIFDVTGPDGTSILTERIPDGIVNNGDAAVLVPLTDTTPLEPGTYTISVESESATTAGAIVKQDAAGEAQVLNVKFWVATSSDEIADQDGRDAVGQIFRDTGDTIFGPANLSIGTVDFIDAPQAVVDQFSELPLPTTGNSEALRELCSSVSGEFGQDRSLHFVLVDSIVDPDDDSGVTLGIAAGIPGATIIGDTRTGCVVVTANAGGITLAGNATTVWHEAGHLLGLNHTTEADGSAFDFLPDTFECDISNDANDDGTVDETECTDGANFMFHDTNNTGMSEDQGNLIAAHPLFQPAS